MTRILALVILISLVLQGCDKSSETPSLTENPTAEKKSDTPPTTGTNEPALLQEENESVSTVEAQRVASLARDLKSTDPYTRDKAAKALVKLGDVAVKPLADAARHDNWLVRHVALTHLAEIGADKSIKTFIEALKDENSLIREYAAIALGDTPSVEATKPLLELLSDKNPGIVPNVIYALYSIGEQAVKPALRKLQDSDPLIRLYVVTVLGYIGHSEATAPLAKMLATEENPNVRGMTVWALGMIGDKKALDPLAVRLLEDDSWAVRSSAAKALHDIGDAKAVEPLLMAVTDPNPNVRMEALYALKDLGNGRATDCVKRLLKSDPHGRVRSTAASVLNGILGKESVDALIEALDDSDPCVRKTVAALLGKTGDAGVLVHLRETLKDDDTLVRVGAVLGVARIGGKSAIELLTGVLKNDPSGGVRCCAAMQIGESGDKRPVELLITALDDIDPVVRFGAAVALGDIGDTCAIIPLKKLKKHSSEKNVVLGATYGLYKLTDDTSAFDIIIKALQDKEVGVRVDAVRLLGKMGDKRAIEPLIYSMGDAGNMNYYVSEALKKLTGEDFGLYPVRWRKWFRSKEQQDK